MTTPAPAPHDPGAAHPTGRHRPIGGLGTASSVLIGLMASYGVVTTWLGWEQYTLVSDAVTGARTVTLAEIEALDSLSLTLTLLYLALGVVTGVTFLVWLWRTRGNAELASTAPHRRARGWVLGGWFVPVVNFWFPYQIVADIYRASAPNGSRGTPWLAWWWASWLVVLVLDRGASAAIEEAELTVDTFRTLAIAQTLTGVALVSAAIPLVFVLQRITAWQNGAGMPQASAGPGATAG
ncbi:DUF4328 domain-containing protein [Saccharomonospora halophila]|uniref:DUF4328 domain-containing protein n=1 Tax=Saccharomonospora halophila TaxID=129922 RepID=UPI0003810023|nr:DUF4328 domain-containing protein [Saccharomonospora halophila]